jgi:hypothetical protein
MKRREFLAASALAGMAPMGQTAMAQTDQQTQFVEWRIYTAPFGDGRKRLLDFLQGAAVPAWNRLGINPVGVFNVTFGPNQSSVHVLLPHSSMDSVWHSETRLLEDGAFLQAAESFMALPSKDPGYWRIESSLLKCFSHMPRIEPPDTAKSRIFEIRIYESHNEIKGKKKIHMFNEGGEIEIFRKSGLKPVLFAETIVGPRRPNLVYMLTFADMAEREKGWGVFRVHPGWLALKDKPEYADTVCNINDHILSPAPFSQI